VSAPTEPETVTDACEVRCVHPEAVERARATQPAAARVTASVLLFKAVGDPTRFRLLSALATTELCVCDLAAVLGLSESAVSHQLRVLRVSRLVTYRKAGRVVYYRLADRHVRDLLTDVLAHVGEGAPT
jgi:DNA-binding transcriptional ArsR family regulator